MWGHFQDIFFIPLLQSSLQLWNSLFCCSDSFCCSDVDCWIIHRQRILDPVSCSRNVRQTVSLRIKSMHEVRSKSQISQNPLPEKAAVILRNPATFFFMMYSWCYCAFWIRSINLYRHIDIEWLKKNNKLYPPKKSRLPYILIISLAFFSEDFLALRVHCSLPCLGQDCLCVYVCMFRAEFIINIVGLYCAVSTSFYPTLIKGVYIMDSYGVCKIVSMRCSHVLPT